ncbi:F-box/LRR-repeat protein 12-like [Rutidosis leptorrhynchoides]|uniref:F-box/LRR-repeat protein 12-like n=1 Tax=Rutidosis leptorrhynchoides TaxID=125765 RepID=UPI003A9A373B
MDVSSCCLCITQLPDDLLRLIYQKLTESCDPNYCCLTSHSYQKNFVLTCHRFLDIASPTPIYNKCLDDVTTTSQTTKLLSKPYNNLNLDVPTSVVLSKYLHHRYRRHFDESPPSSILFIDLCNSAITDSELETLTKFCKNLIGVSLVGCSDITNVGIVSLRQNCPRLRILKISGCDKVVNVVNSSSKQRRCLLGNLDYLQADSHVLYPNEYTTGSCIRCLDISYSTKHSTDKRGLLGIGSSIGRPLQILAFSPNQSSGLCSYVTDRIIEEISKGCSLLEELNLSKCSRIGLSGWRSIASHCWNLKRLHVNDCANLCDEGLLALGNGRCKRLSVLYMTNCPRITSSGINKFKILLPDVVIEEKIGITNFPSYTNNWQRR